MLGLVTFCMTVLLIYDLTIFISCEQPDPPEIYSTLYLAQIPEVLMHVHV